MHPDAASCRLHPEVVQYETILRAPFRADLTLRLLSIKLLIVHPAAGASRWLHLEVVEYKIILHAPFLADLTL